MRRLESLPSFQRWAVGKLACIAQEVARDADARVERARQEAAAAHAIAQAKILIQSLLDYFTAKGDVPALSALKTMNECTDLTVAQFWLKRAYAGETSAQIFPDAPDNPWG